jgi:hypothetical protein
MAGDEVMYGAEHAVGLRQTLAAIVVPSNNAGQYLC